MSAGRLYSWLLHAFPRRFRARYGSAMRECFHERYSSEMRAGRRFRFLLETLKDVLTNATLERMEAVRQWLLFPNFHGALGESERRRRPMSWSAIVVDLRYAVRTFVRTPVFTSLTVIALGLGIGANSAIFSVVRGVLLKPLPFAEPHRLVMVWDDNTREGVRQYPLSPGNFLDVKAAARTVDRLEAMYSFLISPTLQTNTGTERLVAAGMTPGMFELLGRTAALGRALQESDRNGVIVLSDGCWRRRFGADPGAIGRKLSIDGEVATVVGVMPPDFHFPAKSMLGPSGFAPAVEPEAWIPIDLTGPQFVQNGQVARVPHFLSAVGRLAPNATVDEAREELGALVDGLERRFPDVNRGLKANVVALHDQAVGRVRPALALLLAGVGLVLLMACVNVAGLLLARSSARQKEMAVRTALGAGRRRLIGQMLVESLSLSSCAGAVGLALGWACVRVLVAMAPPDLPRVDEIRLDGTAVVFTALIALIAGVVVGMVPAFAVRGGNIQRALKDAPRGLTSGVSRSRMRTGLVVIEIGLAMLLTIGAGLLTRSFQTLLDVDPGFRAENLLTLQIQLPNTVNSPEARRAFYATLFDRVDSLPGVAASGGTTRLPLGSTNVSTRVTIEGRQNESNGMPEVEMRRAVHNYFRAMGMNVVRGRTFTRDDLPGGSPVVVVNETMARRLWPHEDPVGKRFKMGADPATPWSTVIGVVGDVRHAGLDAVPSPEFYVWYLQGPPTAPFLVVRTQGEPQALVESLRATLKAVDKDLAVHDIRPMTAVRAASVAERRFVLLLAAAFGLLALVSAAVGVYGVMALIVGERTQEMGIRLALGAEPVQVLALVLREGGALAAAGIATGLAVALVLTPAMASQLYGVGPNDPVTLLVAPALLFGVALLACLVPARRAMKVDAVTTLRYE